MIRVLQVFGRMDRGGAETMIMELYRNIDRSKVQFDFVVHTKDKCGYDDEIDSLGGKIYSVCQFNVTNTLSYKKEWELLLSNHPEWSIIHGHVRSTASIYLKIANSLGRYTISHSHSVTSGKGLTSIVKDILQKKIKADYYFACSRKAGEWLYGKRIIDADNFKVLPNAIRVPNFKYNKELRKKVREEFGLSDNILLGHVGNFKHPKNHSFLLKIFKSFLKIEPTAKLMLVGSGELFEEIKKQAKESGVYDNILFLGMCSNVNELMQAMDVFVFPSVYEGLGVVLIEAQAEGLPCIVSENIPEEAYLSDLITTVSLDESPDKWAECIKKSFSVLRKDYSAEITKKGYDVSVTSKWLEEFYLEKSE